MPYILSVWAVGMVLYSVVAAVGEGPRKTTNVSKILRRIEVTEKRNRALSNTSNR